MSTVKRVVIMAVLGAAAAIALGTGIAVAVHNDAEETSGQELALSLESAPTTRLDGGTAPSGARFEVSRIRPDSAGNDIVCLQIEAASVKGSGCLSKPSDDKDLQATQMMLGEDLFVATLVDDDVQTLRILPPQGVGAPSATHVVDLGKHRLMYALLDVPRAALLLVPAGGEQIPVPPDIRIETIDRDGDVIEAQDFSAAPPSR